MALYTERNESLDEHRRYAAKLPRTHSNALPVTDDELIQQYAPLVRAIALKFVKDARVRADPDDLIQLGMLGLVEARRRYTESTETTFKTFAYYRIRGSIIDGLKSLTGVSRAHSALLKKLRATNEFAESMANTAGGDPASVDAAAYVEKTLAGVLFVSDYSELNERITGGDEETNESAHRESPEKSVARREVREIVRKALERLPSDERYLLDEMYVSGKSLADIGASLGYSRSWACRMHARAIENARIVLAEQFNVQQVDLSDATPWGYVR